MEGALNVAIGVMVVAGATSVCGAVASLFSKYVTKMSRAEYLADWRYWRGDVVANIVVIFRPAVAVTGVAFVAALVLAALA